MKINPKNVTDIAMSASRRRSFLVGAPAKKLTSKSVMPVSRLREIRSVPIVLSQDFYMLFTTESHVCGRRSHDQ